jgi:SPP1 family phage portal protein
MSVTPVPARTDRIVRLATTSSSSQPATNAREWLTRLEGRLRAQQDEVALYEAYFVGDHPLKFATDKFKSIFGNLFGAFSDNWLELVTLASVERLEVTGFRTGGEGTADQDIWRRWQDNNLDNGSVLAHTEAIKTGRAYVIVNSDGRMAVEHPAQVIVAHVPGDRRQRLAALKKWIGADGHAYANVYLPTEVVKYRSKNPQTQADYELANSDAASDGWDIRRDDPGGRHGFGVVPVIPLYNNPGMLCDGTSDLRVAIPLTNAINKQVLDMMISSEFAAFPQRVLTGVELPKDPVTNQPHPTAELKAAISRLWNFENKDAKVTSLETVDLNNYVKPIEMLIQHLAAQTRTPPHYLLSSIVNASGDALKAAEAGLVSKVEKKILDFSDAWEEAMRLSFKATGDRSKADATDLETIWADPEKKSEAEKVDAAQKLLALDVPHEIAWERAGLSPKEIEKAKKALPETLARKAATSTPPAGGSPADPEQEMSP